MFPVTVARSSCNDSAIYVVDDVTFSHNIIIIKDNIILCQVCQMVAMGIKFALLQYSNVNF